MSVIIKATRYDEKGKIINTKTSDWAATLVATHAHQKTPLVETIPNWYDRLFRTANYRTYLDEIESRAGKLGEWWMLTKITGELLPYGTKKKAVKKK